MPAAVVKVSGRPATLDENTVARARTLIAAGWTQQQAGEKFGVGSSAVSHALTRHRAAPPADPGPALELPLTSTGTPGQDDNQAELADQGERGQERGAGGAAGPGATAPAGQALAAAPRIAAGTFECRYAGAMLAHAFLDWAGIGPIFTALDGGVAAVRPGADRHVHGRGAVAGDQLG